MRPPLGLIPFLLPFTTATPPSHYSDITEYLHRFNLLPRPQASASTSGISTNNNQNVPLSSVRGSSNRGLSRTSSDASMDVPYRPSIDVECDGQVPPQRRAWPQGVDHRAYQSQAVSASMELAELDMRRQNGASGSDLELLRRKRNENWWLCSSWGLEGKNLAMVCNEHGSRPYPLFNVFSANSDLYTRVLKSWCLAYCWCGGENGRQRGNRVRVSESRVVERIAGGLAVEVDGERQVLLEPWEGEEDDDMEDAVEVQRPGQGEGTCDQACSNHAGCGGSSCVCAARRPRLNLEMVTVEGSWLFVGECMSASIMGWPNGREGLGRRAVGEETVCPCNASYVSRGCCGAESGMIWEERGLKKGVLVTKD